MRQSHGQMTPNNPAETPKSASQMKPQPSWSSETLSRRLEADFSHADPLPTANTVSRGQHRSNGSFRENGHAHGKDTALAGGNSRGTAAQRQLSGKAGGQAKCMPACHLACVAIEHDKSPATNHPVQTFRSGLHMGCLATVTVKFHLTHAADATPSSVPWVCHCCQDMPHAIFTVCPK